MNTLYWRWLWQLLEPDAANSMRMPLTTCAFMLMLVLTWYSRVGDHLSAAATIYRQRLRRHQGHKFRANSAVQTRRRQLDAHPFPTGAPGSAARQRVGTLLSRTPFNILSLLPVVAF